MQAVIKMESTLHASTATNAVGVFGSLPTRTRKARRQKSEALASPGISSRDGAVVKQAAPGVLSTTGSYAREAVVDSLSDAELVELVLAGDQDAFSLLVERYKDAVQNLAYRMLSNVTEAEDVTQEVFVRAYTQLATYKPAHKFSTWLLSIASHLAIDQLRRRRFLALPLEDVPFLEWVTDMGVGPEQSALEGEQQDEIQSYLRRLPSKYRAVIVLRYYEDMSEEQIAATLGCAPGTVKSQASKALAKLRAAMPDRETSWTA